MDYSNVKNEVFTMTLEDLKELSPVELEFISSYIYQLIKNRIDEDTKNDENYNEPCECPHCKSKSFIKYGFNNGKQKYYCKNCSKYFVKTSNKFFEHSKTGYKSWKSFIAGEIMGLTLREQAPIIERSVSTCFYMRHKLYKAIEKINIEPKLKGLIEIDSQYININLKGTKPKNMPRNSKKRGRSHEMSGISHQKVCLVTAIDEHDNMLFKVSGLGPETFDKYYKYRNRFESGSTLVSDSNSSIANFAKSINCKHDIIRTSPIKKRYMSDNSNCLSQVNQLHKQLSDLLVKKNGISIRHLQNYLDWLLFVKKIKYTVRDKAYGSEAYMQCMNNTGYVKREVCKKPLPIDLREAYNSIKS